MPKIAKTSTKKTLIKPKKIPTAIKKPTQVIKKNTTTEKKRTRGFVFILAAKIVPKITPITTNMP